MPVLEIHPGPMQAMKSQDISDQAKRLQESQSNVALEGLKPKSANGASAPWTAEDVAMAVLDIYDMCERVQFNFILLGELAKAVWEKTDRGFNADKLELAMFARQLTPEIKSLFKTWNFEQTDYGYKYYFTPPTKWDIKIPVEIHVIKRDYKFLKNPDVGFFSVDEFRIPNPFENYWKARFLVQ